MFKDSFPPAAGNQKGKYMIAEIAEGQLREKRTLLEALSLFHIRDMGKTGKDVPGITREPRIAAVGVGGRR